MENKKANTILIIENAICIAIGITIIYLLIN